MVDEVIAELQRTDGTVSPETVRRWMASTDPDVMGATDTFVSRGECARRIQPPLAFDEVFSFKLRFFEVQMQMNRDTGWTANGTIAGCELVAWFVQLWDQGWRQQCETIKGLLRRMYVDGDARVKLSLEHAVIEHLFERAEIMRFFEDWRTNPQLAHAYAAGREWVDGGGTSPLTGRKR